MTRRVLNFLRELRDDATSNVHSDYNKGYTQALDDVIEYVLDLMWENGEDEDEDRS